MPAEVVGADTGPGHDVFAGVPVLALLADGRPIRIVPSDESDVDAVRRFYADLSDTATYYRFFGIRPALPDDELRRSVEQDPSHHVMMLAWLDERLIGIGEFTMTTDPNEAELAVTVADDHHHEGVATLLLERLAMVARQCDVQCFIARTLPGNTEMKVVLSTLGLTEHIEMSDDAIAYRLDLGTFERMQRKSAARMAQALRAGSQRVRPPSRAGGGT